MRHFLLKHRHAIWSENGFTLLELMLVLGVAAIMLTGVTSLTQSWVKGEMAENGGNHLQRVLSLSQRFVEANWSSQSATPLPETADVFADVAANPTTSPWKDLIGTLKNENLLNGATGALRSPLGVDLQIAYVKDASGTRRLAVFSKKNLPNGTILKTARQVGAAGGTIGSFPNANEARGAFGQWSTLVADLRPAGTTTAFPCAVTATRGCVVAVASYHKDTLCGAYLYRKDMSGECTDANTMFTTLNMLNNDITNAKDVTMENLTVRQEANLGTTSVVGRATFNGPTTMASGLVVNPNASGVGMTVTGDANFSGTLTADNGTVNATQINATGIDVSRIDSDELNSQNLTMDNGMLTVDDSIDVTGNVNVVAANGVVNANNVNANAINTGDGRIVTGQMSIQNTMNITGDVYIDTGSTIFADKLLTERCQKINNGGGTNTYDTYGHGPC